MFGDRIDNGLLAMGFGGLAAGFLLLTGTFGLMSWDAARMAFAPATPTPQPVLVPDATTATATG